VTLTRRSLLQLLATSTAGCCFGSPVEPMAPGPDEPPPPVEVLEEAARTAFAPAETYVLSIGVLAFQHEEMFSSFPSEGRRDDVLVETFIVRGVPTQQVVRVRDAMATRAGILAALDAMLARLPLGADFVFYYAGHGYRDDAGSTYFAAYDTGEESSSGVGHDEVLARLDASGRRALFLIDCCYSGALGETVLRAHATQPYAVLASSLASELSTGAWTFTDAVIEGLNGAAHCDADHDGAVTLANLADYAESELAFADGQLATYACTARFPSQFLLAPASALPFARFGEHVEVQWRRRWWPAKILAQQSEGFLVHYVGFESTSDEVVPLDRIRPYAPEMHAVGSAVDVRWHGEWFPAVVLEARLGIHRIHYEGFEASWDEWVSRARIRLRRA
jgi:hypothetical protein